MNPITISEKMMFTTVRIETKNSCGTGFFYNFKIDDAVVPVIITNKHVINDNEDEEVSFFLHLSNEKNEPSGNYKISIKTHWFFHPSKDLCFMFIAPILQAIKENTKMNVYYIPIDKTIILSEEKLNELSALEEVVMVGYPVGLWDRKNNYPIFRKGYTSSHPAIDFNEQGIGLVDIACFPGSSGSPIFILNETSYTDKKNTVYLGSRTIFLGILFSAPAYDVKGNLIIDDLPTNKQITPVTKLMTNLGYYIKASELNVFEPFIREIINRK